MTQNLSNQIESTNENIDILSIVAENKKKCLVEALMKNKSSSLMNVLKNEFPVPSKAPRFKRKNSISTQDSWDSFCET